MIVKGRKRLVFKLLILLLLVVFIEGASRLVFYAFKTSRAAQSKKFRAVSDERRSRINNPVRAFDYPYLPFIPKQNTNPVHNASKKGFRGKDFKKEKAEGNYRIFCLGGSTTYGISLKEEETYPHNLEVFLNEYFKSKIKGKIEVINAGEISWTSMELLIQMSVRCMQYDPDLFIYYEGINDVSPAFVNAGMKFSGDYSHYRSGEFNPPKLSFFDKVPRCLDYSALFTLIRWRILRKDPTMGLLWTNQAGAGLEKYKPVIKKENYVGLEVLRRNLVSMAGIASIHKIPLVFFPQFYQQRGSGRSSGANIWGSEEITNAMKENYEIQKDVAKQFTDWVIYIDILKEFNEVKEELTDAIHFTPKGSAKLAVIMGNHLVPVLDKEFKRKGLYKE
ncbi:MAG: hypothetical protein JXA60_06490 [Candidatus Coatesbacteria bacterium]|nr:hypothetical protein [Candidatus Coatesbacteria bacterium]